MQIIITTASSVRFFLQGIFTKSKMTERFQFRERSSHLEGQPHFFFFKLINQYMEFI